MAEVLCADARTGIAPRELDWPLVARARRLMRSGLDLHEASLVLGVRPRDLDVTLWKHFGGDGW
jgi:hypothetical protein